MATKKAPSLAKASAMLGKKLAPKAKPAKKTAKSEKPRTKADIAADKLLGGKTTKVKKESAKLKESRGDAAPTQLPNLAPDKIKIPKKLNECVDLYEAARRKRLEIQQSAQEYAALEGRLREHLIDNVEKSDAAGVTGKTHRVTVKIKPIPRLADTDKFMKFAHKKGNEDLLTTTPNAKAIAERWEANKAVPGVETFNVVSLSLNKL